MHSVSTGREEPKRLCIIVQSITRQFRMETCRWFILFKTFTGSCMVRTIGLNLLVFVQQVLRGCITGGYF